jgi:hypothetical protein
MTDPAAARAFLQAEIDGLEPFAFVAAGPAGNPFHAVEVTRLEERGLEVRVPGRPPVVPELSVSVRSALRDLGFASENPSDPTLPWARAVADTSSAVDLVQRLHTEVFEEKPDFTLDVVHGSHKPEHEARRRLDAVRERIERVTSELVGNPPARDEDGDYVIPMGDVHVIVAPRAAPSGPLLVRVFAITNVAVTVGPELGLFLARLNFGLTFGRFALDAEHRSIWFDEILLGDRFEDEDLRFIIRIVAGTADEWDDRLKHMFGGSTYQEVLNGRSTEEAPPIKPGQGGYL